MNVHFHYDLDQQQKEKWTEFWKNCKHSHAQQHISFGEVERSKGRIPVYIYGEENGEINSIGIFSIHPLFMGNRFSLEANCLRGPAVDNVENFEIMMGEVITFFKSLKVGSIRISPYWFYPDAEKIESVLKEMGFLVFSYRPRFLDRIRRRIMPSRGTTGLVDLNHPEEEILASFSRSTRREIRRAGRENIEIRLIKDINDAHEFYKHFGEMSKERGLIFPNYSEFEGIFENILKPEKLGILMHAYSNATFLSGLLMFKGKETAHTIRYVVVRAPLKELSNLRIGPFLWWKGMLWAKEKGCSFVDMEGSPEDVDKSSPVYRVQKFKKGFNPVVAQRLNDHIYICNSLPDILHEGYKMFLKISLKAQCFLYRMR